MSLAQNPHPRPRPNANVWEVSAAKQYVTQRENKTIVALPLHHPSLSASRGTKKGGIPSCIRLHCHQDDFDKTKVLINWGSLNCAICLLKRVPEAVRILHRTLQSHLCPKLVTSLQDTNHIQDPLHLHSGRTMELLQSMCSQQLSFRLLERAQLAGLEY